MSAVGRALSKLLDSPKGWANEKYVLCHLPTGTSWWVGNGSWFFDGYPASTNYNCRNLRHCLGLFERHYLYWKAYKYIRKNTSKSKEEIQKAVLELMSMNAS